MCLVPQGYTRKGTALEHLRRMDEAAACFRKAVELEPDSEVAKKVPLSPLLPGVGGGLRSTSVGVCLV